MMFQEKIIRFRWEEIDGYIGSTETLRMTRSPKKA